MAQEHQSLRARYTIPYGKSPEVDEEEIETETVYTLTVKPEGKDSFEHDHSRAAIALLDELGIPYDIHEEEVVNTTTSKVRDKTFIAAAENLAESLSGDDGSCDVGYSGGITVETLASLGASKHIERRKQVEAFFANREVPFTLECELIFSSATCRPLTLVEANTIDGGQAEVIEEANTQ